MSFTHILRRWDEKKSTSHTNTTSISLSEDCDERKLYPLSVLRSFVSGIHTSALGGLKCNWGDIQSLVKDYPLPEVGTPPPQNLEMLD